MTATLTSQITQPDAVVAATGSADSADSGKTPGRDRLELNAHEIKSGGRRKRLRGQHDDNQLLDAYLSFVRDLRDQSNGSLISLRDDDLDVLAVVLGRSIDDVRTDLERRMRVAAKPQMGRRRRVAVMAGFGLALIGGGLVMTSGPSTTGAAGPAVRPVSVGTMVEIGDAVTLEKTSTGEIVESRSGAGTMVQIGTALTMERSTDGTVRVVQ